MAQNRGGASVPIGNAWEHVSPGRALAAAALAGILLAAGSLGVAAKPSRLEPAHLKNLTRVGAPPSYLRADQTGRPFGSFRGGSPKGSEWSPLGANFTDIPSPEISLTSLLPSTESFDHGGSAFARSNGQVCVLMLEGLRLRSIRSTDQGQTFAPEVEVAGGLGQPGVRGYSARLSGDNKIYAALIVADPSGELGLQFVRSDDMGLSWTQPAELVGSQDPSHGVREAVLETGPNGRAAVIYRGNRGNDPYVIATSNSGATWTAPVRVNDGVAPGTSPVSGEGIAIDGAGRIFAVFTQSRFPGSSSLFTARSTDGGVSFSGETSLDGLLPFHETVEGPAIRVASDGGILIAVWDDGGIDTGADYVYCLRSNNGGASYIRVFLQAFTAEFDIGFPVFLASAPNTSTVFLFTVDILNQLSVFRSTNNGGSFGPQLVLSGSAAGSRQGNRPITQVRFARASGGTWAVAWSDQLDDPYSRRRTDVNVMTTTTEGASWNPQQRADSDTPGSTESQVEGLVATSSSSFFVLYSDGRPVNGRSASFHANRSMADPLSFGTDYRIDADLGQANPAALNDPVIATDGASHVYVAFSAIGVGPFANVHVAASADGGRRFGAPVRVGNTPAGSRIEWAPVLRATPDGYVYVAYISDGPGGSRQIRFNRSTDFGATWSTTDTVLGGFTSFPAGYYYAIEYPAIQMTAVAGGRVYVTWSNLVNVFLARSSNGGASFFTLDVDQDTRQFNRYPQICAQGDQVILAYRSPDLALQFFSVWAIVSVNSGVSFSPRVQLRPEGIGDGIHILSLACDGGSQAVVVWSDFRTQVTFDLYANRFDGVSWTGERIVNGPFAADQLFPEAVFVSPTDVVVAYDDLNGSVYASRSTNGGASFPTFEKLDDASPDPASLSAQPIPASDGAGNVWVAWLESSAGLPSVVVRHASDGGAAFGPALRLDRAAPQGAFVNDFLPTLAQAAALPGVGLFAWAGERSSPQLDALVNAHEPGDLDRDMAAAGLDCNDFDPQVSAAPGVVASLAMLNVPGGARVTWDSQDAAAGPGTVYDVVSGSLPELGARRDFGAAACLASGLPDGPYDDLRPGPPLGEPVYYLVRARNSCGIGSYGDSSILPDPRDGLDAAGPCP